MAGSFYFIIPFAVVLIAALVVYAIIRINASDSESGIKSRLKSRDRNATIREANKKLSQNPRDADALKTLADLYYQEEAFNKSIKMYEILVDLSASNKDLDEFETILRYAISALRIKKTEEAYKGLLIARTLNETVFEVNYNLGYLEYGKKNFEKAQTLLTQAKVDQPEHAPTLKYLGLSLYQLKRFEEAAAVLQKSLEIHPDDKETLFALGRSYYETEQVESAIKILSYLRTDEKYGARSALYVGTLHLKTRSYEEAALDFEIGLRHEKTKAEILLELKYRLAIVYVQLQQIEKALQLFQDISSIQPDYKDVSVQMAKYRELSLNNHLKTFLLGGTSDFVTLCRKLTSTLVLEGKVNIIDISVQKNECVDFLAEVRTPRWEDLALFRYIRASGHVGELSMREMYARIKEVKAGRGFCVIAGDFTDSARQFVEARLIDLINKDELVKKLNRLSSLA